VWDEAWDVVGKALGEGMETGTRSSSRGLQDTRSPWRVVLIPFVVSRLFSDGLVALMVGASGRRIVSQGFALYDGRWYLAIARAGYPSLVTHHGQTTWAFFPLYPAAVHVIQLFGLQGWEAGVLISHLAFYVGLAGLYRLVARRCSPTAAILAVWTLARGCPEFRGTWVTARVLVRRPPESRAWV
jgi:hypothetical protein